MHHLTARPSPRTLADAIAETLDDAPIALEDPVRRRDVARAWIEHAASERAEAASMAKVASALLDRELPADLHWIAARATTDELRHAAICAHVAQRYDPKIGALPRARHFAAAQVAVAPQHASALHVIVQCCVQETVAAAYLERAHAEATSPLVRSALRALFSDEIDHGRIGFAFAATLTSTERQALRAPVAALVSTCRDIWRGRAESLPAASAPEHGVLASEVIVRAVDDAIERLVWPGLVQVGLG